ncbi:MAG TPA: hypothetical protein VJR89_15840 [Polyangiales bacterium]|nr:hypothetical protein [Polyangiales bacterium]
MSNRSLARWLAAIGCGLAALSACSSISSKQLDSIGFEDVWTAQGIPCDGKLLDLLVRLEHEQNVLRASSLIKTRCFPLGHALWRAELPVRRPLATSLPLTVEAEIALEAGSEHTRGLLTLASANRLVLTRDRLIVTLTRGAAESASPDSSDASDRDAEQDMTAKPSGSAGEAGASTASQPSAASAGTPGGAAGMSVMSGAGQAGKAGSNVATAGHAGSEQPAAGGGAPATDAGAPAAGARVPAAGMTAPPENGGTGGSGGNSADPATADVLERISAIRIWYCVNVEGACVCIKGKESYDENYCVRRPTACCYAMHNLDDATDVGCACFAEGSGGCRALSEVEGAVARLEKCPP